jgi:hypothetical protein
MLPEIPPLFEVGLGRIVFGHFEGKYVYGMVIGVTTAGVGVEFTLAMVLMVPWIDPELMIFPADTAGTNSIPISVMMERIAM